MRPNGLLHLQLVCATLLANAIANADLPLNCDVVIAGAGIGGAYTAYRLVVEAKRFPPDQVCIFEARSRPGGRILSVRDPIPGFEGFTADLGAYRYVNARHI